MNRFAQQRTSDRRVAMQDEPLINRVGAALFTRYKEMHSTWASVAFFVALVIFCFSRCINSSKFSDIDGVSAFLQVLVNIAIVILLCKIVLLTVYEPFEVMVFSAVILTALLSFLLSGSNAFLILSLFIVAVKGINARTICIIVLCVVGFCLVAVIFLSLIGVLENETVAGVDRLFGMDVARRRLGFDHQNNIGGYSLVIFLCYLYLRYKKFGAVDVVCCLAGIILLYFVVSTKTTAFIIAIGIALVLVSKVLGWRRTLIVCSIIACISVFAGIYFAWAYDPNNGFLESIDHLLSGRLSYAHDFLIEYPVLPFGQGFITTNEAEELNVAPRILDNAYIHLLLRYGLVALVITLTAYGLAFVQVARKRNAAIVILLALMLLYGNSETWFFGIDGVVMLCIAFGVQPGSKHKIEKSLGDSRATEFTRRQNTSKQTLQNSNTQEFQNSGFRNYPRESQITSSRNYPHKSQNAKSRNYSHEFQKAENNYPAVSAPVSQPTAQIKPSRNA